MSASLLSVLSQSIPEKDLPLVRRYRQCGDSDNKKTDALAATGRIALLREAQT
jgi:hypothetical protein